jgi:hypothetical protein
MVLVLMPARFGANRSTGVTVTLGLGALKVAALVLFTMVAARG